jgi:membrane protease YdiL (CAAX protease family)
MFFINPKVKTRRATILFEILFLFLLLLVFSWFIHDRFPVRLVSFLALILIAVIISNHYILVKKIERQLRNDLYNGQMLLFNLIGLQLGFLIAIYFRFTSQMSVLPKSLNWFLITGIAIAITEELLFRGFLQSMIEKVNYYLAPTATAFIHSAYKVAIFIPIGVANPNLTSLFSGSLIAFIALGYLKQFSRSIVPSIIAHVAFDVLVYAEYSMAPWWVW